MRCVRELTLVVESSAPLMRCIRELILTGGLSVFMVWKSGKPDAADWRDGERERHGMMTGGRAKSGAVSGEK